MFVLFFSLKIRIKICKTAFRYLSAQVLGVPRAPKIDDFSMFFRSELEVENLRFVYTGVRFLSRLGCPKPSKTRSRLASEIAPGKALLPRCLSALKNVPK